MNKLKCAVVGVGYLGNFHAEKYHNLPNAELIAVCDSDPQRCEKIASIYDVPAYTDYNQLISAAEPDAVSIVVPTSLHHAVTKVFLANKIHVLLEKPITTTLEEADELITLARENNLVLQIGHLERFNPVLLAMQKILDHPLFIESVRLAPFKLRGTDVCVNLDLMIHDIDIVQHLVKSPIKNVHTYGAPVLSDNIDICNARVEFANGCVANFTASRVNTKPKRKLRIFQRDAYLSGDLNEKILTISRKNSKSIDDFGAALQCDTPEIVREEIVLEKGDAIKDEIKAFIDAIIKRTQPLVSGEDGKLALATALQITQLTMASWQQYVRETNT